MSAGAPRGGGRLVAVEGPEGSGKTTQLELLKGRLADLGIHPRFTREPGGTPLGEAVRSVVLSTHHEVAPLTEFLLYSAARAQHVKSVIHPALEAGINVITDRFFAASVAYQGYGRGLDLAFIQTVNSTATRGIVPDLTLLLDLEPESGLARAAARGEHDRLESAGLDFHRRVREGYLKQAAHDPSWVIIDANASEEEVAAHVWNAASGLLIPQGAI